MTFELFAIFYISLSMPKNFTYVTNKCMLCYVMFCYVTYPDQLQLFAASYDPIKWPESMTLSKLISRFDIVSWTFLFYMKCVQLEAPD